METRTLVASGLLAAMVMLAIQPQALAYPRWFYDPGGDGNLELGGSGVWDTTTALWRKLTLTETLGTWPSETYINDEAHFPDTGSGGISTVTIDAGGVSAGELAFGRYDNVSTPSDYTIQGGSLTLDRTYQSAPSIIWVDASGQSITINSDIASITGLAGIRKMGLGNLVLNGNNTWAGGIYLENGYLQLGSANAIPSTGEIRFTGGALKYTANTTTDYSSRFSTAPGQKYKIDTNGQDVTLASDLDGTAGYLLKFGLGTLTLTGNNVFDGTFGSFGTWLNTGVLSLGSAGAIGSTGPILWKGGTLQYTAANTTDYSSRFNNEAGARYRFDTNGQDVTFATGLTSAGGSLTKLGAGTLTLTGDNTFTGATTISGGTLLANNTTGSATGSGGVSVNSGGTLGGTGALGGPVTITSGGTLAPGASVGTLTINSAMTLHSGALFDFELGSMGSSDLLSMASSTLALNGQQLSDFTFSTLVGFGAGTYTLFDAGNITGSLGANLSGTVGGFSAALSISGNDLVLDVTGTGPLSPGDFDGNGVVNNDDLMQWEGDYGLNGNSDADGDGNSDGNDFLIWQREFDGLPSPLSTSTAVPEPGTLALLAAGLVGLIACKRR